MPRGRMNDYDDRDDFYPRREGEDVEYNRVRVRERERDDRGGPSFLREDARRSDAGPLVLRQRDVEVFERSRSRHRSPSPVLRVRRARSVTPPTARERERIRVVEKERFRSPSRERVRRVVSPPGQHEHIRIVDHDRHERSVSLSSYSSSYSSIASSPERPAKPEVVKGPVIEREVITHYTDVDHGVIDASPRPRRRSRAPERTPARDRDVSVDVYTSKNRTEVDVDIHKHERSRSRRQRPVPDSDGWLVVPDKNYLSVRSQSRTRRRAHSADPLSSEVREEAASITGHINARGRVGEARHGATRDWTIVDVPPGTERVRMDGAGGGAAEVTWQRYNGVRRARFIPNADTAADTRVVEHISTPRDSRDRLSIQVHDRNRQIDVEKTKERRVIRPSIPAQPDVWTEITRDLVSSRALNHRGYAYEATEYFFYVMEYLSQNASVAGVTEAVIIDTNISTRTKTMCTSDVDTDTITPPTTSSSLMIGMSSASEKSLLIGRGRGITDSDKRCDALGN